MRLMPLTSKGILKLLINTIQLIGNLTTSKTISLVRVLGHRIFVGVTVVGVVSTKLITCVVVVGDEVVVLLGGGLVLVEAVHVVLLDLEVLLLDYYLLV